MPATAFPMHVPVAFVQLLTPLASTVQLISQVCPPEIFPLLSITQAVVPPPVPYVKFPLLCPNATAVHKSIAPRRNAIFLGDMFTP
jgi:hypothetical protein